MKRYLFLLSMLIVATAALGTDLRAQLKPMAPAIPVSQMNNIEELVNRYFVSLNEPDDKKRRDMVKQVWSEKGKFGVVRIVEADGLDAIDELTKGDMLKFPNTTVRRTSHIDCSGNYYRWNFVRSREDGKVIASGVDYAIIVDGKLLSVIGFLDSFES